MEKFPWLSAGRTIWGYLCQFLNIINARVFHLSQIYRVGWPELSESVGLLPAIYGPGL